MQQPDPLSILGDAGVDARDRYRWLLLAGWFVIISIGFSFAIAAPRHAQPIDGVLIALAAAAVVVYNLAIKRYWTIALGLFIALIAVMWAIVA